MPKLGKKLAPNLTTDLGQGILRVMEDIHTEMHPDLQDVGGYFVHKD
jgi:UDP-glucose 4-epimerase